MFSPLVVFLMGPTASGKTDLAVELVQNGPFEIISVDSAMVYRGMDIGTAKPDAETLHLAPHRLIDIRDPAEPYSAADFRQDALAAITEILEQGKMPLLVGGTMLYFRALEQGLAEMPEADPVMRAQLERELDILGLAVLHQRLQACDPVAAARIHPNDPQRILRALEVYELSGKPISQLQQEAAASFPYPLLQLVRAPLDRDLLRQRIADRFHQMLDQGFEKEVRTLWMRGDLHTDLPSMRSVGYRQMLMYLRGEVTHGRMAELAITATRQLAKRQMTWLRGHKGLHWLNEETDLLGQVLKLMESGPT